MEIEEKKFLSADLLPKYTKHSGLTIFELGTQNSIFLPHGQQAPKCLSCYLLSPRLCIKEVGLTIEQPILKSGTLIWEVCSPGQEFVNFAPVPFILSIKTLLESDMWKLDKTLAATRLSHRSFGSALSCSISDQAH